jgi:hypothetical protein
MLGLFRRTPKLEATFTPSTAVARELAREVEVAGRLALRNVGKDVEVSDLALVLVAGGTRRIDLDLPAAWRGGVRIPAGGEVAETVQWTVKLTAPMRAPAAEIQVITVAGGKHTPLAKTDRFPLGNE